MGQVVTVTAVDCHGFDQPESPERFPAGVEAFRHRGEFRKGGVGGASDRVPLQLV